jgi:aminoglycoside phosphotransferase (APT) family kinase protein
MSAERSPSIGVPTQSQQRDLDQAKRVVEQWLSARLHSEDGVQVNRVTMPDGSGVSSETLMVDAVIAGVDRRYVVKVDTPNGLYMNASLKSQYEVANALRAETILPVPELFGFEADASLLGQPFYVMECIAGKVPADNPPFHLSGWVADQTVEQRKATCSSALDTLVNLHKVDVNTVNILNRPARGSSGFDQEFNYYLEYGRWAMPEGLPELIVKSEQWLKANYPDHTPTGFSWGDARMGNMMFKEQDCVAVFDWEMASLGGAELDLAWWSCMDRTTTLSLGIPHLEGVISPAELIAGWEDRMGRKAQNMKFYLVFNAYRLAVIVLRLSRMLQAAKRLPPESEWMLNNNTGMQYLATMLDIEPAGEITQAWPGLD